MKFERSGIGFTLTEVLIVVVILGILAGLILPRFTGQAEQARAAEAVTILTAIRQGEEAYLFEQGAYLAVAGGGNWAPLGMQDPNSASTFFTYAVISDTTAVFTASAIRNATNAGTGIAGTTIGLAETGVFCGDHPNTPTVGDCPS